MRPRTLATLRFCHCTVLAQRVQVAALVETRAKVEIEVTAVLPD